MLPGHDGALVIFHVCELNFYSCHEDLTPYLNLICIVLLFICNPCH